MVHLEPRLTRAVLGVVLGAAVLGLGSACSPAASAPAEPRECSSDRSCAVLM